MSSLLPSTGAHAHACARDAGTHAGHRVWLVRTLWVLSSACCSFGLLTCSLPAMAFAALTIVSVQPCACSSVQPHQLCQQQSCIPLTLTQSVYGASCRRGLRDAEWAACRIQPVISYVCSAGTGNPLTLVMTDVEGSTELWEWDKHTTMRWGELPSRSACINISAEQHANSSCHVQVY